MAIRTSSVRRCDRILQRKTPLLFAHRGGAKEAPESTKEAFKHAVECGVDVLEVDIGLTKDSEMVVWHGPELEKVRAENQKISKDDEIGDVDWQELKDNAWVVHPNDDSEPCDKSERRLMLLADFLELVSELEGGIARRTLHVNIELKAPSGDAVDWDKENLTKFLDLVDTQPLQRKVILASFNRGPLRKLRGLMLGRDRRYPTNLSLTEQLAFSKYMKLRNLSLFLVPFGWWLRGKPSLVNCAFETSHALASTKLVSEVRKRGGSLYVFLTKIPFVPGIDDLDEGDLEKPLFKLLDTGVDGIMTDYPKKVGTLMEKWKNRAD